MTIPPGWQDFGAMIGGASGALTGLLFVAVSLNATRIAGHAGLRASAAQTLVLFITPLIAAAALLTPHQPDWVLGAEFIATGLAAGWVLLAIRRIKHGLADEDLRLITIFNRPAPSLIAMVLLLTGGAILAAGQGAGLYLLLPASVVAFVSGVLNAWYFLLPPPAGRQPRRPVAHSHPGRPAPVDDPPATELPVVPPSRAALLAHDDQRHDGRDQQDHHERPEAGYMP